MKVLVVGVGPIGIEYTNVLRALGHHPEVIGRSMARCREFSITTGWPARWGGIEAIAASESLPEVAIVATSEPQLGNVTSVLLKSGVRRILVEKPGGADFSDVATLAKLAQHCEASVYVAYNRRFYASVERAQQLIREDGGVTSCFFEFTEWSHRIEPLVKEVGTKENWFLNNSTHVIDLAFHLAGWPEYLSACASGELSWHPKARYCGSGRTSSGALFAYIADWQAPGRWSIELMTKKRRLIFRPLEKLQEQMLGSIETNFVPLNDSLDVKYKPGFYRQVEAFLADPGQLLSLSRQASNLETYRLIHGGSHP